MAWTATIGQRGVCGNFRFKFYDITDAANTISVVKTDMNAVRFLSSTNTSDNADNFKAQTLNWTGTCDADTANNIEDSSETFVGALTGLQAFNTLDTVGTPVRLNGFVEFQSGNTDNLLVTSGGSAFDLCPTGDETFIIADQRHVMIDPVTNADDGTLFVMGE